MITLQMELSDLDLDALIDRFLPTLTEQLRSSGNPIGMLLSNGMPVNMAKGILSSLTREQKEKLVADLINGSQAKLSRRMEASAAERGVSVTINSIHAIQS